MESARVLIGSPAPVVRGSVARLGLRRPDRRVRAFPSAVPEVSLVVPTRNEAGNIAELLVRLDAALAGIAAEVIFVDDSDDETPEVIRAAAGQFSVTVRLLHREPGMRTGRLGGAVVAGFQLARAPWAVVIDGDLQHPPEVVPSLVLAGMAPGVDLVYGTRYAASGDSGGLSGHTRAWVSRLSTVLAKALFPRKLRGVTDPMSGFFAVRLAALDLPNLRPSGYKILLEILAVSRLDRTSDVPFSFQPRFSGDSKASLAEGLRYLTQLAALRLGTSVARLLQFTAFLTVGASGVVVNTGALLLLTDIWGRERYLLASTVATNIAIVWNFLLLEKFVFRNVGKRSPKAAFVRFWLLNVALLPVQLGLLALSVDALAINPIIANVLVLSVVFALRYAATSMWVYRHSVEASPQALLSSAVAVAAHPGPRLRYRAFSSRQAARFAGFNRRTGWVGATQSRWWHLGRPPLALRLAVPVAATLLAFPAADRHVWNAMGSGTITTSVAVATLLTALLVIVLRAAPAPDEPDVHDRQLDLILAVPMLVVAVFLSLGWSNRLGVSEPWSAREAVAASVFLASSTLLMLGTRFAARIRWALVLPLLTIPAIVSHPLVNLVLISMVVAVTVGSAGVRHRRSPSARHISPDDRHRFTQRLPPWQLAGALVIATAGLLAFFATTGPAHNATASVPSIQHGP